MIRNSLVKSLPLLALSAALASAQQYVAVDLTPNATNGAMGFAVSGGSVMTPGPNGITQHASLFANGSSTDIQPPSWLMSFVAGISGTQQAGVGVPVLSTDASAGTHAVLWFGSAASVVDLHPSALVASGATCTNGSMQGGYGIVKAKSGGKVKATNPSHAMVWFGSASSSVDLNPPTAAESKINGCSFNQEAGYIMPVSPGFTHAALWNGPAPAATDLHPAGYVSTIAFGVANSQQVGYGVTTPDQGGAGHAMLWNGTASSSVDLHPAGYTLSIAFATNGTQQVGEADDAAFPRHKHAMVWTGSAQTAVDLNQFLPAGFNDAQAMAIDAAGNIVGYANNHAFMWVPVR